MYGCAAYAVKRSGDEISDILEYRIIRLSNLCLCFLSFGPQEMVEIWTIFFGAFSGSDLLRDSGRIKISNRSMLQI